MEGIIIETNFVVVATKTQRQKVAQIRIKEGKKEERESLNNSIILITSNN